MKAIFLDFGGCIDAPGIHTRTLFWEAFLAEGLVDPNSRDAFQEAYSRADAQMMSTGIAKDLGLKEFNRMNGALISQGIGLRSPQIHTACDSITEKMKIYLEDSRLALSELRREFPLALISNFTGNLEIILREFSLHEFFFSVTESFYVGASKPDLKIFQAALATQKESPNSCVYIGDNPRNDVEPAKKMGMKAILIHTPGNKKECGADGYLTSLRDLPGLIHNI